MKAKLIDWVGTNEYPTFNIADAALLIGVVMFIFHSMFLEESERPDAGTSDHAPG
jgi:lipoprotein signal peptidase